jgi:tRNA nucleotidyltransferase/poly(A) polymerase
LARRDFTINAIAFSLTEGRIIDPYFGIKALRNGIIEAVLNPEYRFHEDATRLVRGLRFASQLHFAIEERTWLAMKRHMPLLKQITHDDDGKPLFTVPREAIGKEFLLGFLAHPAHTIELWHESQALQTAFRELQVEDDAAIRSALEILDRLEHGHMKSSFGLKRISNTAKVAALFAALSHEHKHVAICRNLFFHQFPKRSPYYVDCDRIAHILENAAYFAETDPVMIPAAEFERRYLGEDGAEILLLAYILTFTFEAKHAVRERILAAKKRRIDLMARSMLSPLISGSDLKALGFMPGPAFRSLLNEVRTLQLEGTIETREAALMHLKGKSSPPARTAGG